MINNEEFRSYLFSRLSMNSEVIGDLVSGGWGIEFIDNWGIKNNNGFVTIHYLDRWDQSKVYSYTMESDYYNQICQEFRQYKIDLVLC
jgi:hypothetical protein